MKKEYTLYFFLIHTAALVFMFVSFWFAFKVHQRNTEESRIVEKYGPGMQQLCDELEIGIRIQTFNDLMKAFKEITTKTTR